VLSAQGLDGETDLGSRLGKGGGVGFVDAGETIADLVGGREGGKEGRKGKGRKGE